MKIQDIKNKIPQELFNIIKNRFNELRPSQEKAIKSGLLEGKNLLVCTPTASGKTLIAELAFMKTILEKKGKAVYIVPLKALATEKYKDFKNLYSNLIKIALSIGDLDSSDPYLENYDLIICTSEKLDSLIRHKAQWIKDIKLVIVDEIHLLNDVTRGPTLEILITLLRNIIKDIQIIGLSATIGNPKEMKKWMNSNLVIDNWRPVKLEKGIYVNGKIEWYD